MAIEKKSKAMQWFKEEFLTSLEKRMTNPKYPNQCILSQKQADVCFKYMDAEQHKGDYGFFLTYVLRAEDKKYTVSFSGRYTFLTVDRIERN